MPDLNLSTECMTSAAENLHALESLPSLHAVIIAMSWDPPWNTPSGAVPKGRESEYVIASLDRLIDEFEQRGITVVLFGPLATPNEDTASIVARQMAFHRPVDEPLYAPESAFLDKEGDIIAHYADRSDIVFIRPDQIQCNTGKCDFIRDGASLFADDSHLAEAALPLFRPVFEPGLKQAFIRLDQSGH
jgi:hypothetical protein